MAWRQGVRVQLEKADGATIWTGNGAGGRFREAPEQRFRINIEFGDDFEIKGGTAVKVVLAVGYEDQTPGYLDDVQCYGIDRAHLTGVHTFDGFLTWKPPGSRVKVTPFTIPATGYSSSRDKAWQDHFNASKGDIAVFVVRGDYLDPENEPESRRKATTDPPQRCRFEHTDQPRIIRWDWFEALDGPCGEPLVFDFHNTWVEEKVTDRRERAAARERLKSAPEAPQLTREVSEKASTSSKRSRETAASKKETTLNSRKRTRQTCLQDAASGCIGKSKIAWPDDDDQDDEEVYEQKAPEPDIKKEAIEIPDDDDNIALATRPTHGFPATTASPQMAVPEKNAWEDDEEMLKLKLDKILLRQKRRKIVMRKQDPNADVDEDEEMVDMQLEEIEIKQTLRKKQLK